MRRSRLFLFACLSALSLSSCFSPRSIVTVEADAEENMTWNYGHQVVNVQADSVEVQVYFDEYTKDFLIFDVEITNWRNEPVLISPEEIYLETGTGIGLFALDPEQQIFEGKVKASRREAGNKNAAVALGVATVAAVVAVAATTDSDNDGYDGGGFVYVSTGVVPPPPLAYLPPDHIFWEDFSLRKTTLQPRYRANGKVVFRRLDNQLGYSMVVPVGGTELRAGFKQRVFQP